MIEQKGQRSWAEIDLDALKENIKQIRSYVRKETKIMAVVKADAYGHGVFEVSKCLLENGADELAVACIDEAIQLRRKDILAPILVLGYTSEERIEELLQYQITSAVYDLSFAQALSRKAVSSGKTAKIHIKIDTGMGRIGFLQGYGSSSDEETLRAIQKICSLPGVYTEGIFTHFSKADEEDDSYTRQQFERFMRLIKHLEQEQVAIPVKHVCNSAATLRFPDMHLNMVRPGIILYGCYPAECCKIPEVSLKPVMALKTRVIHIKTVEKGRPISYGGTYITSGDTKIATIPIGYADGYSRRMSNKAPVIAGGKIVRVIGNICMDQCMIDVNCVNNICVGDQVTLFGSEKDVSIPVEKIAELNGTISYEILCVVGKRIPRVYLKDGKIVGILNFLKEL